jgi:glyceraldehyde-3-phosphate dehydrogenase/erythrose-4-phosphate dehydrogenase
MGIDLVLEYRLFNLLKQRSRMMRARKRVLISAPAKGDLKTIIWCEP